ncbi:MAG TPA: hypothetical protein PKC13_05080, partial [Blastocatellia bacterium]|nr:hypothetical protein [Blastocatellia bacterium]
MNTTRLTTKIIWLGLAVSLTIRGGAHLAWQMDVVRTPGSGLWIAENALKTGALCLGYLPALLLNLEIAKEHRQTRWLHAAWLALAANAGVSIVRMIVESSLLNLAWPGYTRTPLWGLLQHLAIVPANLFLLLGLLAMWWAYQQVGLGFTVEKRDYAVLVGILVLMFLLLFY